MWYDTPATRLLGITVPIIQGPFGGGPSSVELVTTVSNAGGLGSFGMQTLEPAQMIEVARQIRAGSDKPFAINLWMSGNQHASAQHINDVRARLQPYCTELGQTLPEPPERFIPDLDEQLDAMLEIKPPVFSFVFGVPPADVIEACKAARILTMGTATTPREAMALEAAGIDCIVASGFEAGGHKGSFLESAEASLTGTFALIPQVVDAVSIPVIAAGGIADARGVAAALVLGAHGVQIGTAFLACNESAANHLHREALFSQRSGHTTLTKAFTGRLARSLCSRATSELDDEQTPAGPYPVQAWFMGSLGKMALAKDRADLISLSAGQAAPLVHHVKASDLIKELIRETPRVLQQRLSPSLCSNCATS